MCSSSVCLSLSTGIIIIMIVYNIIFYGHPSTVVEEDPADETVFIRQDAVFICASRGGSTH